MRKVLTAFGLIASQSRQYMFSGDKDDLSTWQTSGDKSCAGNNYWDYYWGDFKNSFERDYVDMDGSNRLTSCVCRQKCSNNSGSSCQYQTVVTQFSHNGHAYAGVKSIIFATTHHSNRGSRDFEIKYCWSDWTCGDPDSRGALLCAEGSCPAGYIDASALNPAGLTVQGFRFKTNDRIGICKVFMYQHENWATASRGTTLTWHGTRISSSQVQPPSLIDDSTNNGIEQINAQGLSSQSYFASASFYPTCVYNDVESSNLSKITMIVYEFAQHLNLKEFQISKSEDGEYDIWIPDMNDPEFADPTDAATRIAEELDANNKKKLSDHQSGMIALSFRTSKSDILSIECNIAACETYAPKRLILAPKEGTDLRLCGFSIMAEPMTCPATAEQCKHVNLEVPTQTIGEVSIATLGSTVLSDQFYFGDSITDQCGAGSGCSSYITHELLCFQCPDTACASPALDADLLYDPNYKSGFDLNLGEDPRFNIQWPLQSDNRSVKLQITSPSSTTRELDHKCVVLATLEGFSLYSNSFLLYEPCLQCVNAVIYDDVQDTPTLTYFTDIAVGSVGRDMSFTSFSHTAMGCTRQSIVCNAIQYSIECKEQTESDSAYTTTVSSYGFNILLIAGSGDQMVIIITSSDISRHKIMHECRIKAELSDSGDVYYAPVFEVSFEICQNPLQSCLFNVWNTPGVSWTQPTDMIAYVAETDVQTSSFDTTGWVDYFTSVCNFSPCGAITFEFVVYDNNGEKRSTIMTDKSAPADEFNYYRDTLDASTGIQTLSYRTANLNYSGTYKVKIVGTLACGAICEGTGANQVCLDDPVADGGMGFCKTSTYQSFKLKIVSVCEQADPCAYTAVEPSATILTDMVLYVQNVEVRQTFARWGDKVSVLCSNSTVTLTCTVLLYELQVKDPTTGGWDTDSSFIGGIVSSGTDPYVKAKTSNYEYCGVHTVRIQGRMVSKGVQISVAWSNEFTITVDCCDARSCLYTQLISHQEAGVTGPQDYQIGVDNVAGSTTFPKIQNTAAVGCGTNDSLCGQPTYTLEMTDGSTVPTFLNSLASTTSSIVHSSQTIDLDDEGSYELQVKVFLDKSSFATASMTPVNLQLYTDPWVVTVDVCDPLPCGYNKILTPDSGALHPNDIAYIADGITVKTTSFEYYRDEVSLRCFSRTQSQYTDLCYDKIYTVETVSGASLPAGISPSGTATHPQAECNDSTRICTVTGSSTNNADYGKYDVRIRASFDTPTSYGTASDETSVEFQITIQRSPLCNWVEPQYNSLTPLTDCSLYLCPQDFSIYTVNEWGYTYFDGWNDTYTEECYKKNGFYSVNDANNFIAATPFDRHPVLAVLGTEYDVYPIYTLVDSVTLEPLVPATFDYGDIVIKFDHSAEFTKVFHVAARTDRSQLKGKHNVKIRVQRTATSAPYYTNAFILTVIDPCNPIVCAEVSYFPSETVAPDDTVVVVGEGFVPNESSYWTTSHSEWCTDKKVWAACGTPTFSLYDADTELPVTEFRWKISHSSKGLVLQVLAYNEELRGESFNVFIKGDAPQSVGTGGQSLPFVVEISTEIIEEPDYFPMFDVFPASFTHYISESKPAAPLTLRFQAVCTDDSSEIGSLTVENPNSFIEAIVEGSEAVFYIYLSDDIQVGSYETKVACTDIAGQTTTESFSVDVKILQETESAKVVVTTKDSDIENEEEEVEREEKPPINVTVKSISMVGEMVLQYSRSIVPVNHTSFDWHNETQFSIVFKQRSDETNQTDQFDYEILNMTDRTILVQLKFASPLDVSQGKVPDKIEINMLRSLLVVEVGEPVWENTGTDTDYFFIEELVPKQVQSMEKYEKLLFDASNFQAVTQVFFYLPLGFHLVGVGSMDMAWVLFRQLQIFEVFCQFNLKLPANVIEMTQAYSKYANQQLIPPNGIYDNWLQEWDESRRPAKQEAEDEPQWSWECEGSNCQYKQQNRTLQQETEQPESTSHVPQISEFDQSRFANRESSQVVLIPLVQTIVLIFSVLCLGLAGITLRYTFYFWMPASFKTSYEYLKSRIFWNFPIRVLIQQYMIVTMSVFLNFRYSEKVTFEDKLNRFAAGFSLVCYSILFPVAVTWVLCKYFYKWQLPEFAVKFDSLTISLYVHSSWSAALYGLSMIRQFIIIFLAVKLEFNLVQFAACLYLQEFYTIYLLDKKPMKERWRNIVEQCNEILLFAQTILMCTLTDFVPSPRVRYNITGWLMIYIMQLQFTFNAILLLYQLVSSIRISFYKLRLARYKRKLAKLPRLNMEREDQLSEVSSYLRRYEDPQYLRKQAAKKHKKASSTLEPIEEKSSIASESSQPNYNMTLAKRRAQFQKIMDEAVEIKVQLQGKDKQKEEAEWVFSPRSQASHKSVESHQQWNGHEVDKDDRQNWYALPKDYENPYDNYSVQISDSGESQLVSEAKSIHSKHPSSHQVEEDFFILPEIPSESQVPANQHSLSVIDELPSFRTPTVQNSITFSSRSAGSVGVRDALPQADQGEITFSQASVLKPASEVELKIDVSNESPDYSLSFN